MAENDQEQKPAEAQAGSQAGQEGQDGQRFAVQRVYVKDASFEAPDTPTVFRQQYSPQVNFNINNRSTKVDEGVYEVVLRLTADVKQDDKTVFLVEVQQAGIFEIRGLNNEQLEQVLTITCPNILFPYGREAIDGLVTRGSFPALLLAPINFENIYQQAKQQQAEQLAAQEGQQAAAPGAAEEAADSGESESH
ncbi:protein-export chaperone SecB [Gammaproteobacteria bacterium]|jgi:preprotein translocase subunit SecB|nr:protein-export chaperone SecB [Gammaproteobacteria bacterium]